MTTYKKPAVHSRWFEELTLPLKLMESLTREADAAWARQLELQALEDAAAETKEAEERQRRLQGYLGASPGLPPGPVVIGSPNLKGCGSRITLVEPELVLRMHDRMTAIPLSDKQRRENLVKTIQHVAARGPERVVHRREDWEPALERLRDAHANFRPVIDFIDRELTLAGPLQPLVLTPMLLNGPPGCGKTFFVQHLAEFFGTGFERVSMETTQSSAELSGTAAFWSNTQPGRIFNRLVDYDFANPVFLLDEIDKAGGSPSYRSDKALYGLLERESAKHWADTSLPELTLDASHVIWLLTSNDARNIPAPLRSRMRQFDIEPLSRQEARKLVRAQFRKEVERYPHLGLNPELAIAHCDVLCINSPRVIVRFVHELIARLAKEGRQDVELSDLEAVGALGSVLVEFDRHFRGLIEWKVQ